MISYETAKKFIFKLDPENAHTLAEIGLRILPKCRMINNYMVEQNFVTNDVLAQEVFGVKFPNPIGLGAGFDKNATMVEAMPAMGFGYTEIGTMTPKAQPGNPKPRMFRYPEYESVQNAMGFNNKGAYEVIGNLKKVYPFALPIGASIGKNKVTPEDKALEDYETLIKGFKDICDYLVVNISSPNTPNLRDLQNEEFINSVFGLAKKLTDTPILLKIAPDMQHETAISLCKTAIEAGADGIIATNTTNDYSLLPNPQDFGGLSGKILSEKSYELFKAIGKELHDKTVLISVGGIGDAKDAYRRIKAGASLVQIYSALVFQGPAMCKNINNELTELIKADGYNNITEAIGADFK